jgi:hypothetical protein
MTNACSVRIQYKKWKVARTCRGVKLEKTIRTPLSITLLENVQ